MQELGRGKSSKVIPYKWSSLNDVTQICIIFDIPYPPRHAFNYQGVISVVKKLLTPLPPNTVTSFMDDP